ncbi:MAG TPA: site-specific integrase, partial [Candidatus Aminicenantes bacterium]|nr:site-specific integrase [Candidatus Aminicenantes bacterium]
MKKQISEFLSYLRHERNASPHTISAYARDLAQLEDYFKAKGVGWESADNVVLRGFLAGLYEKKQKKSTIGRKLASVRSFYEFLVGRKRLEENPARVLATPRREKRIPSFLSEEEAVSFLDLPDSAEPLDQR